MTVIQEMKEAKLRYLADTMKDYAKWLSETSQEQSTADRINEFAESIEEVLAKVDGERLAVKTLDIRRLECKRRYGFHDMEAQLSTEEVEEIRKMDCVSTLMGTVQNLVNVKTNTDEYGRQIVSASIYVGVPPEKIQYINQLNR